MGSFYIKLIKKIILMLIITFLPLASYLYLNEEVKTTFISNIDINKSKYIVTAELELGKDIIISSQRVVYINETNRNLNRIYLYLNMDKIKIESIKMDKKQASYNIIGKDNILMIMSETLIQPGEIVDISIDYLINVSKNLDLDDEEKSNSYELKNWYPVIIYHDDNGWDLKSILSEVPHLIDCYNYIRIYIPEGYTMDRTSTIHKLGKIKKDGCFFQVENNNTKYLPLRIKAIGDTN